MDRKKSIIYSYTQYRLFFRRIVTEGWRIGWWQQLMVHRATNTSKRMRESVVARTHKKCDTYLHPYVEYKWSFISTHTFTEAKPTFRLSACQCLYVCVCSFMLGTADFRSFWSLNPIFSHCYEMRKGFHWFCHLSLLFPLDFFFVSLCLLWLAVCIRCANFFIVIPTRSIIGLKLYFHRCHAWMVPSFALA